MKSGQHLKKKHRVFAQAFESHVDSFIKQYRLFEPGKKIIVAVSAGVDSLGLAQVLANTKVEFEMLHFNHATRPEHNTIEEQLVRKKAKEWNVDLRVVHGDFDLKAPNFEAVARQWRKSIYQQLVNKGGLIITAHHLDDSYEWSLMQSGKQASLSATLGIPLISPGIRRPFLCVSKKQIYRYARASGLTWIEDLSNRDVKFERNFLRAHITHVIAKKYPRYLRHYVAQKNELAQILGIHARLNANNHSNNDLMIALDPSQGVVLKALDFHQHKAEVKKWIQHFSEKKRGEIDHELDKLLKTHEQMQQRPQADLYKGPMIFSGGVMVYVMRDSLFIMGQSQKNIFVILTRRSKLNFKIIRRFLLVFTLFFLKSL